MVNTPIMVRLRDPLHDLSDGAYRVAKKLRLEPGAYVASTCTLSEAEAAKNRDLYVLRATQAVEGGFDSVNVYDRGILSWGIMQWASHSNSLQDALWYVKGRLQRRHQSDAWAALFKANGLDVQRGPNGEAAFFVGSNATGQWRPVVGLDDLRVLFRGTKAVGKYDAPTVTRWSRVFARAGRQPVVQALQAEWATRRLSDCLDERVDGGKWRVRDFGAGDLFSDALYFALWTNNPAACREHFRRAIRQARLVTGANDPAAWPPGLFPFLWEQTAAASGFGTWPQRTASVNRSVPVGQIGRARARVELVSRGWQVDKLRQGVAAGRTWRRAAPAPVSLASGGVVGLKSGGALGAVLGGGPDGNG